MATATGATAGARDIVVQENATFVLVLIVKTGDPLAVVDITGAEAQMMIRDGRTRAAQLLTSSPAAGIAIDGSNGKITVSMTPAETLAFVAGDFPGRYDLRLIYPDSTVDRLLEGSVEVVAAQTR